MLHRKWRNEKDGFARFMQTAAEMHKTGYSPFESNGQSTKKTAWDVKKREVFY
jgi:hypothetical protein